MQKNPASYHFPCSLHNSVTSFFNAIVGRGKCSINQQALNVNLHTVFLESSNTQEIVLQANHLSIDQATATDKKTHN
jgi:hypothetical protein